MSKSCFVIMPTSNQKFLWGEISAGELHNRYSDFITEALLRVRPNLEVFRADLVAFPGVIARDVFTRLMNSDYVIADISYPNPNVFYELGIRHACRSGTILIKDENTPQAPFDVADLRYISYSNTLSGLRKLSEDLKKNLDWIDANTEKPDNHFLELAKTTQYKFPVFSSKTFPSIIEQTIYDQLYALNFYKEAVVFEIDVVKVETHEVEFITELSYFVVNRTDERNQWNMEYKYDVNTGKIIELRYNNQPIDARLLDIQKARGVSILHDMEPRERASVYFKIKERFRKVDYGIYTSYHPASDLKVSIHNPFSELMFDFEIFYFRRIFPVYNGDHSHVYFDKGVLPHQGVRLNWR